MSRTKGFSRIRALTKRTNVKAAGNSSVANQEYVSGSGTFQNMGVLKKRDPTSSGLIDSLMLKTPLCWFTKKGFSYL